MMQAVGQNSAALSWRPEFDRSKRSLYLELMGKGINLVLADADGRILDCTRRLDYSENARRALLPGLFYIFSEKFLYINSER